MKTPKNFNSKAGYQKYLAYGHGDFAKSPGNTPVKIAGKAHKVNHSQTGTMKHNHPAYR